jgi:hypothetical protein
VNTFSTKLKRLITQHSDIIFILTFIVFASLSYYLAYYKYRFPISPDEGHLVSSASRVLNGQLPLKDFYQTYSPGRYWILAFLFKTFGSSLAVERLMMLFILTMTNVLMLIAAKRILPILWVAIPLLMISIMPGVWNKAFSNFLLLLNIWMIYRYLDRWDRRSLVHCGIAVGLSVWIRQDIAGYAALTFLMCVFFHHIRSSGDRNEGKRARWISIGRATLSDSAIFSLVITLIVAPMGLIYWLNGGFLDLVRGMTIGRVLSVSTLSRPFVSILHIFSSEKTRPPAAEIVLLNLVLLMFILLSIHLLLQLRVKNRKWGVDFDIKLFSTLSLATMYFAGHQWSYPQMFRLPQDGALIYILTAVSIKHIYFKTRDFFASNTRREQVGVLIGGLLTLTLLLLPASYIRYGMVKKSLMAGGLPLSNEKYDSIETSRGGVYLPEENALELNQVVEYIFDQTESGDTIFAPSNPALYFLTDRSNASRQVRIIPSLAESWAAEDLIEDLERNKPALILLRRPLDRLFLEELPFLYDEITRNYSFEERFGNHFIFGRDADRSSTALTASILYYIVGDTQKAFDLLRSAMNGIEGDPDSQRILAKFAVHGWKRVLAMLEGYLIWNDATTWHIRWRGNEEYTRFTGRIKTSVVPTSIETYGFDPRDRLTIEDTVIRFSTLTPRGVEGLDLYFHTDANLVLDIRIDRVRDPSKVYIGAEGDNPSTIPIRLP